jgi:hypothetical protein
MKAEVSHGSLSMELGQVEEIPIGDIHPSAENNKVYQPLSLGHADDAELVKSIRSRGVMDPLIITLDNFILSGHRRHWAAGKAGLKSVPCRRIGIWRDDPEFLPLLAECNKQRNKSFDEILRETIIASDPEEAHRSLREYRQRAAQVSTDTIQLHGKVKRRRITKAKQPLLDAIRAIIRSLRPYWPVTDRQIHYALLNAPPLIHASKPNSRYRNDLKSYKAACELITRARLTGQIAFPAIHDPTRPVVQWEVHRGPGPFIQTEMDRFLKGYSRDLQVSQPCHIEIVGEKNTIESILRPVAADYCIPLTIGRGYASLPPRHGMVQRFWKSGKDRLVLLVVSDFDPEGEDIAHSFARSLRDDFEIQSITPIKVALTKQQVVGMNLPPGMIAKQASTRRKGFVGRHGENVYELESVPPDRLQQILRDAIDSVIDIEAFNRELAAEKEDAGNLEGVRRRVHHALAGVLE